MQKGFPHVAIILGGVILFLLFVFAVPIPERQSEICIDIVSNCPKKWVLGNTLFNKAKEYILVRMNPPSESIPIDVEGKPCGGFAGEQGQFACPSGYKCEYPKPMYPDAQGKCALR